VAQVEEVTVGYLDAVWPAANVTEQFYAPSKAFFLVALLIVKGVDRL